ncbi:GNAT family N-acetyltransferase [Candidatus Aalborgicola defluviihabitans]|uniref:GNAT family N-acetyltransferase n=1 Tax=Candidatus Aalborgicola defluviihabitans TaxID=3386187 RepID=UPI00390A8284|nr:GNAT family N-acetyltransferase [Burkholderiales bacterium]
MLLGTPLSTPFSLHPLDDDAIASLERATLDAVAPPALQEIDGWLLPFDTSTIGRAKSAVPLRHDHIDTALVKTIEDRYAARGLQAAYRVADVPGLAGMQAELVRLGYQPQQPTLVQIGSVLAMRQFRPGTPGNLSLVPTPAWSAVYLAEGFDPIDGAHRVQALSRSPHVVYAWIEEGGQSVAVGTAAFSQGWASIHGMRTLPQHRGRGLAGRLLATLADAAMERGLGRVFLQVEESNTAALALYQRAGLTTAWHYHYWRKDG